MMNYYHLENSGPILLRFPQAIYQKCLHRNTPWFQLWLPFSTGNNPQFPVKPSTHTTLVREGLKLKPILFSYIQFCREGCVYL